jgi:cell division protein FtsI (penicillin-binding protein 3)
MSPHYSIAGKTGTAQVADRIDGKWYPYSAGIYKGSFVGFFPADKTRYTICIVIRTKPHSGAYYGGVIAAPVFRMISDKIFASGMGAWSGPLDSIALKSDKAIVGKQATASTYSQLMAALNLKASQGMGNKAGMVQLLTDTSKSVSLSERPVIHGLVPDVTGMGLRDAVYLLETEGLQVQLSGNGIVRSQSIIAGARIEKGQAIILQLN